MSSRYGGRDSPSVLREARKRQGDEKWLGSLGIRFLRKYHGKYVAARNRRIVASSSTMNGLYRKLDELDNGMVLIAKVEKPTMLVYVELHSKGRIPSMMSSAISALTCLTVSIT